MSNKEIKEAIEDFLELLEPGFPTAYENVNFKPTEAAFQAPSFLFAEPDNRGYANDPYLQRGIFTNTLAYPINEGGGAAQAKAETVKQHFRRGTTILADGLKIIIETTPEIAGGNVEDDRYIIRVRCRFFAYVDTA